MRNSTCLAPRRTWLLLGLIVALLALAALPVLASGTQDASKSTTPAAGQKVKLTIWGWTRDWLINPVCDEFKKTNPNVDFELVLAPYGDFLSKVSVSLGAGQGPDLIWPDQISMGAWIKAGFLLEMPKNLFPEAWINQNLGAQAYGYVDGKYYSVPWAGQNTIFLINKKHFAEAGLTPSTEKILTWDEAKAALKKVVKKDAKGNITRFGAQFRHYTWQNMVQQLGRFMFSQDGKKFYGNSPEAVQATEMLKSFWDEGINSLDFPTTGSPRGFGTGDASAWETGGWGWANIQNTAKDIFPDLGVIPHPTFNGTDTPTMGWGNLLISMVVPKTCKYPDIAWQYVKLSMTDQNLKTWIARESQVPLRKDLVTKYPELLTTNPTIGVMMAQLPYQTMLKQVPFQDAPMTKWVFQGVIDTQMPIKQALDSLQKETEDEMRKSPIDPWYTNQSSHPNFDKFKKD